MPIPSTLSSRSDFCSPYAMICFWPCFVNTIVYKSSFFLVSGLQSKLIVNPKWCHDVWKETTISVSAHYIALKKMTFEKTTLLRPVTILWRQISLPQRSIFRPQRSNFCLFKRQICRWHGLLSAQLEMYRMDYGAKHSLSMLCEAHARAGTRFT
jgi:hypothetical protein